MNILELRTLWDRLHSHGGHAKGLLEGLMGTIEHLQVLMNYAGDEKDKPPRRGMQRIIFELRNKVESATFYLGKVNEQIDQLEKAFGTPVSKEPKEP